MYHAQEVVSAGDVDNGRSIAMIGDRSQDTTPPPPPPYSVCRPRPNSPLHSILFVALAVLLLVGLVAGCAQSSSSGSSCDVTDAALDCDNDDVLNGADAFPNDACASIDSDGDMLPDSVIQPDDSDSDACTTDSSLTEDTDDDGDTVADDVDISPLNACASLDSDNDGHPDVLAAAGTPAGCTAEKRAALQIDNCPMVFNPGQEKTNAAEAAGDACDTDVDNDDDGLIEIWHLDALNNIRYDLDGSHYDDDGSGEDMTVVEDDGSDMGCGGGSCNGYELMRDLDFALATSYAAGTINAEWRSPGSGWLPIAHDTDTVMAGFQGSGFAAILDGNGNSITNLYIGRGTETRVGLIGQTAVGSEVRTIILADVSIQADRIPAG